MMCLKGVIMNVNSKHIVLKRIKVQNFKSFKTIDLDIGDFNVLIGANAAGKSNFVQIFSFLQDIQQHGLDNAISLQGGVEFVRNFKVSSNSNLVFEMHLAFARPTYLGYRSRIFSMRTSDLVYRFELKLGKRSGFKIIDDKAVFTCKYEQNFPSARPKISHDGKITLTNNKGRIKFSHTFEDSLDLKERYFGAPYFYDDKISTKSLLFESFPFLYMTRHYISDFIKDISIYDFDPKLAKRAVPLRGIVELEPDGSNLAVVLKNVIENRDDQRKFKNLIKDLLPFINNVNIEKFADKSILFNFKEIYFQDQKLPSNLISDGTTNITALILALYFQKGYITILEEPERNIHPSLITKVVKMMKDASSSRQILVTTHNSEMVRYAGIENIYLVTRDKEGFSNIVKPVDDNDVQEFLRNEMEIEELYVQNLLGSQS